MVCKFIKDYWFLWIFGIATSVAVFCNALEKSQCVGREITLSCMSQYLLIHIQYEIYAYNEDANICTISGSTCTGVEFLKPVSLEHCTGKPSCSYTVPKYKQLTTCYQNATAVSVIYQCLEKTKTYDMCTDFLNSNIQATYLTTPDYPNDVFHAMQCKCQIKGSEVNVTTLEHFKALLSPVVFTMRTDMGTQHITDNRIINKIEYTNISEIEINIFNNFHSQLFRAWLQITGKELKVKCGSPVILQPSPTVPYVTQDDPSRSSYVSSVKDESNVLSGTVSIAQRDTITEGVLKELSTPELKSSYSQQILTQLSTFAIHTQMTKELSTLVKPIAHLSSTLVDLLSTTSTATALNSAQTNNTTSDNDEGGTSSEWVLIVAISASVGFILLILVIIIAVLVCRTKKKHHLGHYVNPDSDETLHGHDGPMQDVHF